MNYFEEFDIPVQFFPDLNLIRNRYYELSRLSHPDLKGDMNDLSDSELLLKSGNLNNAYRTLMTFDRRVAYILKLFGLLGDEENAQVSSAFLMEMMDVNESLMEAKTEGDTERLKSIAQEVEQFQEELVSAWESYCRKFDQTRDSEILQEIKDHYLRNKYLIRLTEQLRETA